MIHAKDQGLLQHVIGAYDVKDDWHSNDIMEHQLVSERGDASWCTYIWNQSQVSEPGGAWKRRRSRIRLN